LLKGAQGDSTSYTFYMDTSSYGDSYSIDPKMYLAQQKALETLMTEADTIEEVMLVFSSWQSVVTSYVSSNPTPTNAISVSLSQKNENVGYPLNIGD
jgi:penicillin V acylase-like amidase (Ntn superfamily)